MKYLLLGAGVGNNHVEQYFLDENINYDVFDDYKFNWNIKLEDFDIIVKSSGIGNSHFLLKKAQVLNKKVVTDLELFYLLRKDNYKKDNIIVVTGSNGKTTTVKILERLLSKSEAIGNIGIAIFEKIKANNRLIIEASSFMLEYLSNFVSKYNIILNLTPTHLDYHQTYKEYVKCKLRLFKNIDHDDYIIYNEDDLLLKRLIDVYDCQKVAFSFNNQNADLYVKKQKIYYQRRKIIKIRKIKMLGEHNIANVMACLGVYLQTEKGNIKNIRKVLREFETPLYRLQKILITKKITIYNDSKATNFLATTTALASFKNKKVILIVGGKQRNENFDLFIEQLSQIIRIYSYGEMSLRFRDFFQSHQKEVYCYETLEEIIDNLDLTKANILLFSPACSSYDQYLDFEKRGQHFNDLISKKVNRFY